MTSSIIALALTLMTAAGLTSAVLFALRGQWGWMLVALTAGLAPGIMLALLAEGAI